MIYLNSSKFTTLKFLFLIAIFSIVATPSVYAQCTTSSGTYNQRILTSADDAEETEATGAVNLNGTTYELLYNGSSQVNGLRFTTVAIPIGATITSAYIEFTANTASSAAMSIDIYGQSIDNAPTFTTTARDINSRVRTFNTVSWTPSTWVVGTAYQSSDITTIVQEIINRQGWASGNAIGFILDNTSTANTRIAKSFDNAAASAPRLVVNWQVNAAITLTATVSGCFDSNGNTAGGTNQTTVQVIVDWQNRIGTQDIILKLQGQANVTIDPDLVSKPYVYKYTLTADASTKTLDANWSTTTTCAATQQTLTLPTGNCLLTPCVAGNTGGTVWRDYNGDGAKDTYETAGLSGVTVKAFDCNGNLAATTTTDYLGQYTFGTLSPVVSTTNKYRIEFSNISAVYKPSFNGTNGRTDVQFISAATCALSYGVNDPVDFCQNNPTLITPYYISGTPTLGEQTLVYFPYNSTGSTPAVSTVAYADTIGSTWGLAYARQTKMLYASTYFKRHVGLANNKLGVIYRKDLSSFTGTPTTAWLDVTAAPLSINVGQSLVTTNVLRGLSTKTTPSKDSLAFDLVGKVGFGDLDISDDGTILYFVNLFDKKLYALTISTQTLVTGYPLSIPNDCNVGSGSIRPFGLKVHQGKIYVGSVCDAQISNKSADMKANVYELSGTTFTNVLNFPLDFKRGRSWNLNNVSGYFYPWTNNWKTVYLDASNGVLSYPQAMLTDIEFDGDDMILAFRDRAGDQLGVSNYFPDGSLMNSEAVSGGDILRTKYNNGVWTLENNGTSGSVTTAGANNTQGIGGGEYYYGDNFNGITSYGHEETSFGGLALLPGSDEVVMTSLDALDNSVGSGGYNQGGARFLKNSTGAFSDGYMMYDTDATPGTFQKSNGLGDLELICNPAPIEIGNYVWYDANRNGTQDACEQPLASIVVSLWKGGTQIASTTTNTNGEYYFSSKTKLSIPANWTGTGVDTALIINTAYEIRIDTTNQTRLDTIKLTTANVSSGNGNDLNDSDASVTGNYAVIAVTIGSAGATNHTYDFGFTPLCVTITTPSAAQSLCNGATGANITVATSTNTANAIKFIKFTTDQSATNGAETATELSNIYGGGTTLSTVTPTGGTSPYTATYAWNTADFPNVTSSPITYYVYGILNPDVGASCRPVQEIQVTIKPTPSVTQPSNQVICNNSATAVITLTGSSVSSTTYNWVNNTTSIGLAASGTGNIASFTAINTGSSPVIATITVTPTANGCLGTAQTVTITVNPSVTAGTPIAVSNVCQAGSGIASLSLPSKLTGAMSGGIWSQTSGASVGTALNTTSGALNRNGLAAGTYIFRYTVTGISPCPNSTADVTLIIDDCCPPTICVPVATVKN